MKLLSSTTSFKRKLKSFLFDAAYSGTIDYNNLAITNRTCVSCAHTQYVEAIYTVCRKKTPTYIFLHNA